MVTGGTEAYEWVAVDRSEFVLYVVVCGVLCVVVAVCGCVWPVAVAAVWGSLGGTGETHT